MNGYTRKGRRNCIWLFLIHLRSRKVQEVTVYRAMKITNLSRQKVKDLLQKEGRHNVWRFKRSSP